MQKTTRRNFIKSAGLGAAALTFPKWVYAVRRGGKRPNIIFIMSDDHAKRAFGCFGSDLIETPNIDRIADEGIKFSNCFVTNSLCGPSRASILTGKFSHKNGFRDNRDQFDSSQFTFPKLLRSSGYSTYIVGKWHLGTEPTGFDEWKILIDQGEYYNPILVENGEHINHTGYTTDILTDKALEVLEKHPREKPFCLFIHNKAPHRNWLPNLKYLGAFDDKEFPVPDNFFDDYKNRVAAGDADMRIDDLFLSVDLKLKKEYYGKETGTGGTGKILENADHDRDMMFSSLTAGQREIIEEYYEKVNKEYAASKLDGEGLLKWKYQRYLKDYLPCILSVDENVGRVLDYLDKNNLTEDTIVIYTSDQGFYLGEHGWYDKRFMYEESLAMPLVMRYPAEIKPKSVSGKMLMNIDFASTLLDYAGIEAPSEVQGMSFRKIAGGNENIPWRSSTYYHYYEYPHGWHSVKKHYGIRTERYKLIHFYDEIDEWELYDLVNDPNENKNLIADKSYSGIVEELKMELKQLQIKYGDSEAEKLN